MSSNIAGVNSGASTSAGANSGSSNAASNPGVSSTNHSQPDVLYQSKDAQTMISVLKDMGIDDFEPKIVNQLLEFSYRYITNLLEDAKAFSNHAGKKTIDSEDIKMAIKSKVDYSFTTTPPRDLLMEISKAKNKNPLPTIKFSAGIRLPPDRFCLHAPNYLLKSTHHVEDHEFNQQPNRQNQQQTSIQPNATQHRNLNDTSTFLSSAVPIKRPRADEDDYDI